MVHWTFDDIPDQTGRIAVVTGANTGIGFETARMLAQKGAHVVLACRTPEKGEAAALRIAATRPVGSATFAPLDLSDLDSVAAFASAIAAAHPRLDLLVNNAGVMVPPLSRTKQGFELQFGTNHLGHFALGARLLPLLERTSGARVVVVSSSAQNLGRIDFDDLNWEHRSYSAWSAYGQSKLANMMFALELRRRLAQTGSELRVTAAHPGWTSTDLQRTSSFVRLLNPFFRDRPLRRERQLLGSVALRRNERSARARADLRASKGRDRRQATLGRKRETRESRLRIRAQCEYPKRGLSRSRNQK